MSGMKLTQVAPQAPRSGWLLATAAVVALITVVAGSNGLMQRNHDDNAPAAVILPTPTAWPPTGEVNGTEACRLVDNGQYLNPVKRIARVDVCADTMSDPRVSGVLTRQLSVETFEPDDIYPNGSQWLWGTASMRTAEGSWHGAFTRFANGDEITGIWEALGSGAYDGLLYRARIRGTIDEPLVSGTIAPLTDGLVVGSYYCQATHIPDSTNVAGVEQYRGAEWTCAITTNDARVTGTATHLVDIDVRPDGTEHDWGTVTIEQPDGTWTADVDDDGHPTTVWGTTLQGTGEFAGLQFRFTTTSPVPGPYAVLEGYIEPAR